MCLCEVGLQAKKNFYVIPHAEGIPVTKEFLKCTVFSPLLYPCDSFVCLFSSLNNPNSYFVSSQTNVVFNGKFKGNVTNLKLQEQKNIYSVFHRFGKFLVVLSKEKNVEFPHFKILWGPGVSLLISISLLQRVHTKSVKA